jgi:2-polyprenyl-3-methyl-5-hydroxy-6-metoxy-1,4-benzoquinol methylase
MDATCPACGSTSTRVVRPRLYGECALLRCEACRSELLSPQPSDERLTEIYGPSYYEPWAAEDADIVDSIKRQTFAPLIDSCCLRPGSTVLDLGCATGSFLAEVTSRGAKGFGIDLNREAIAVARARLPEVAFHAGVAADQPFPGVRFDAIVMVDFIEHVRDPEAELRIIREWMHDDSRLVVSTPRADSLLRRSMGMRWPQYREEHLAYLSRAGVVSLMSRAGLRVESIRPTHKTLTLAYAYGQMTTYPVPGLSAVTTAAYRSLPGLRHRPIRVGLGEMTVVARRGGAG